MDNRLMGEQITRYRKERNLTQEELGRAVGVSTQAVSRWENGGAPDVALLPAIADKLGVTVDALFGREGGERVDIHDVVARWVASVPQKDRFDQLCRINWTVAKGMLAGKGGVPKIGYMENAVMQGEGSSESRLATCQIWLEGGFMLDIHAEDMSFASVWPEPEAGYDAYFAPREDYRRLFAVLARPGCLELLEYLSSQSDRLYVPGTIARVLDMPVQEAEELMKELTRLSVLHERELQLEDGLTSAYVMLPGVTLVALLCMARCMMQYGQNLVNVGGDGLPPLLRGEEWKGKKENKHEKK
ncbi:MAG: helix-turn-helix transcriptional regulator [Oscillibacter sp.]|nr:helix-turn-helix transcriptional regulator [Oscillibacter sp.]